MVNVNDAALQKKKTNCLFVCCVFIPNFGPFSTTTKKSQGHQSCWPSLSILHNCCELVQFPRKLQALAWSSQCLFWLYNVTLSGYVVSGPFFGRVRGGKITCYCPFVETKKFTETNEKILISCKSVLSYACIWRDIRNVMEKILTLNVYGDFLQRYYK